MRKEVVLPMGVSGIGSNGIAPLVRQSQRQAQQVAQELYTEMQKAERRGSEIVRTMLKASVTGSGVGANLDIMA